MQCLHMLGSTLKVLYVLPHFFLTTTLHDTHFNKDLPFNGSYPFLSNHCKPDILLGCTYIKCNPYRHVK